MSQGKLGSSEAEFSYEFNLTNKRNRGSDISTFNASPISNAKAGFLVQPKPVRVSANSY